MSLHLYIWVFVELFLSALAVGRYHLRTRVSRSGSYLVRAIVRGAYLILALLSSVELGVAVIEVPPHSLVLPLSPLWLAVSLTFSYGAMSS